VISPYSLGPNLAVKAYFYNGLNSLPILSFDAAHLDVLQETAREIVNNKQFKTYYFSDEEKGTYIKDISELELDSDKISAWGGLTEFSSKVAHVVAKAAQQNLIKQFLQT
jgi:hypothetical protein